MTSLEQDDEDGSTYIVLPEIKAINVEKPGEKEQRKLFNVVRYRLILCYLYLR